MSQEHPPDIASVVEATVDEPTVLPEAPAQRPDGKGYIDEPTEGEECDSDGGGSSVVESLDSADERSHGGWPEDMAVDYDDDEDDNVVDWDVENEDWELADGGE